MTAMDGARLQRISRNAALELPAAEITHPFGPEWDVFKVAGKMDAALAVVVGPDELAAGQVTIRDFSTHEERQVGIGQVAQQVASLLA